MTTEIPANPLEAAAEAIRNAGLHDGPTSLAKAALAAAGFTEVERHLRAVRALVDATDRDAALFGRGGPGCVGVTALRAALAGTYRAPESDRTEHLISLAGGDGDPLDQIQRRIPKIPESEMSQAERDRAYLLARLRGQQERFERVEALCTEWDAVVDVFPLTPAALFAGSHAKRVRAALTVTEGA